MTTETMTTGNIHTEPMVRHDRASWRGGLWLIVVGVLFVALFRNFLWRMYLIATDRWGGDWSHALVIPLIAAYYVYQQRQRLAAIPDRVCWPGLGIMFLGIFSYVWWIYPGRNDMLQGYSMILCLFGLVLFLQGGARMRILWMPVAYLVFGVKVADRIWEMIAWKLQIIAANSAAVVLKICSAFLSINAEVSGSTIELTYLYKGEWITEGLNVAEACSGLRMLAAFVALGVAVAFLADRRAWQRVIMVLLTVPIAVAVNVGRVTILGLLHLVDPEMARGDVHKFIGLLMLIPALLMFLLMGWILDQILIEETPDGAAKPSAPPQPESPPRERATPRWALFGAAAGTALTALVGALYGLMLAYFRPSLIGEGTNRATIVVLIVTCAAALIAGAVFVRKITQRREPDNPRRALRLAPGMAIGILLVATVGLHGMVRSTQAVLIKESIPLRHPLVLIPDHVGKWHMTAEERLSAEVLEELRTENYISRTYRDTTMAENAPGSIYRLHVAYYTGTPDTVPHVPERCYVAGGLVPINKEITSLNIQGDRYRQSEDQWLAPSTLQSDLVRVPSVTVPATLFTFALPERRDYQANVIYFFAANGRFLATPDHVRLQGFDLADRYSYYCKIEVGVHLVKDPEQAVELAGRFLSELLPEIMTCLPDWVDVLEGRWPPGQSK